MISSINSMIHSAADKARDWDNFNKRLNLYNGVCNKNNSLNMEKGETILHLAIRINDATILRRIVIKYPDESKNLFNVSYNEHTPISLAASHKRFSAIRFLIDHNDTIDTITNDEFRKGYSLAVEEDSENSVQNPYLFSPAVIFQGGGAKGIIYNGVVQALEDEGILPYVERVAGASAGAITATLLAIGYTAVKFNKMIEKTPGSLFKDEGWTPNGFYSGQKFLEWIERKIKKQTLIVHCTFGELGNLVKEGKSFKHLKFFATKVSDMSVKIAFDSEDPACADMIISDAVRTSMAVPVYFATHPIIRKQIKNGKAMYFTQTGKYTSNYKKISKYARDYESQYTDGGLGFGNLPIDTYDTTGFNGRVLGFSLTDGSIKKTVSATPTPKPKVSPKDSFRVAKIADISIHLHKDTQNYSEKKTSCFYPITVGIPAMYQHGIDCTSQKLKKFKNHPINADRVVKLSSCGIGTTDFDTSPFEGKGQQGMKEGYMATIEYLRKQWEKISPYFSTICTKNVTPKNSHQFMLVKPIKNITPNSLTQFNTLRSLNPELKLLDILETSEYPLVKKDAVRKYVEDNPHFYLNPHVRQEVALFLAAQSNRGDFNFLHTVITNSDDVSSYFSKSASLSSTESEEENESYGSIYTGSTDSSETESEDENPLSVATNSPVSPLKNAEKSIPASSSQNKDASCSDTFESGLIKVMQSAIEEPGPKGLRDSSPGKDFETYLHGSPQSALKDRDCGLSPVQKFQIFFRTNFVDGKTLSLDVYMNDSMIDVAKKIAAKTDVPVTLLSIRSGQLPMKELNPFHRVYSRLSPVTFRDYPNLVGATFTLDVSP